MIRSDKLVKKTSDCMFLAKESSVIRQKGESQNGRYKKIKHAKFSEKTNISYPLIRTCAFF